MLLQEGLLDAPRNRGAIVRVYTRKDLEEIYELRAVLEGFGARRAATRLGPVQFRRLRKCCERLEQLALAPENIEALVRENGVYHDVIQQAADSPRLMSLVEQTRALPLVYRAYMWYTPEQKQHSDVYHRHVLSALEEKDGAAAEAAMREHMQNARLTLTRHEAPSADDEPQR
ncbi:MAG: GntR family transcriptional regulator [Solirubrobacteraceae bacterium]